MMRPAEREQWILDYLQARTRGGRKDFVDVMNTNFVDNFAEATGCTLKVMFIGANVCPALGEDLSRMHKKGLLHRFASGIQGLSGMGFPKWVYMYSLK